MIVPMKKVSLIVLDGERKNALKKLRKLGLLHIEIKEGKGPRLLELKEQIAFLEKGLFAVADQAVKGMAAKEADTKEALSIAGRIDSLQEEQKKCYEDISVYGTELERIKAWGEIDPGEIAVLAEKGIALSLHEMSPSGYDKLGDSVRRIVLERTKNVVRFLLLSDETINEEDRAALEGSRFKLPSVSTGEIRKKLEDAEKRLKSIKEELASLAAYGASLERAIEALKKEVQFETYASGMGEEDLFRKGYGGLSRWFPSGGGLRQASGHGQGKRMGAFGGRPDGRRRCAH